MKFRARWICGGSLALCAVMALSAAESSAEAWIVVGSRQQAMGGAGVAVTNDSLSSYWNPASLAFERSYDVQLSGTLNGNIENNLLEDLGEVLYKADQLESVLDRVEAGDPPRLTLDEAKATVDLLLDVVRLGNEQSVHFGVGLGLSGRYDRFGASALFLASGAILPSVDTTNLGAAIGAETTPQGRIQFVVGDGSPPRSYRTPADLALRGEIVAAAGPGGWQPDQAGELVSLAEQAGANTIDPNERRLIREFARQTETAEFGLGNNESGALVSGVSTMEMGFSYGRTIPLPFFEPLDDKIALGGTLKYMIGTTFVRFVSYRDKQQAGDLATQLADYRNNKVSHNVGLDLALDARPWDWLRLGFVARNVNSPSFDANRIGSIELKPQVRMGVGIFPIERLVVAFDFDATENEVTNVRGFRPPRSRMVSLGSEYTLPLGRRGDLALRFGAYNNVAGNVNQDWALTGGLGLRIGGFVLDASVGSSLEDEVVRTSETGFERIPTRLNLGIGLKWEKSL